MEQATPSHMPYPISHPAQGRSLTGGPPALFLLWSRRNRLPASASRSGTQGTASLPGTEAVETNCLPLPLS